MPRADAPAEAVDAPAPAPEPEREPDAPVLRHSDTPALPELDLSGEEDDEDSELGRASTDAEMGTPLEPALPPRTVAEKARSSAGSAALSISSSVRSAAGNVRRTVDLGRLRQPVRAPQSKWARRGRRVMMLGMASIGYGLFLCNNGSLGDAVMPMDCSQAQPGGGGGGVVDLGNGVRATFTCVREGSTERCALACNPTHNITEPCEHKPEFVDRCLRDWVRLATELSLILAVLSLSYMAMLGELTVANANSDDSGAIRQTKIKWARVAGYIWTVLVLGLLLSLPALFAYPQFRDKYGLSPQSVGETSAMVFAVLAIMLSLREIIKHLVSHRQSNSISGNVSERLARNQPLHLRIFWAFS